MTVKEGGGFGSGWGIETHITKPGEGTLFKGGREREWVWVAWVATF